MAEKFKFCCLNLRIKCFLIAYLHLLSVVLDIIIHVLVVAIVTNGFQCDVDEYRLRLVDWPWVENLLVIINAGTHGFYPFPLDISSQKIINFEFLRTTVVTTRSQCYPGMIHVYMIDILNFMLNMIWLGLVKSYIVAVYEKDYKKMNGFLTASIVKIILQTIIYFSYQPDLKYFGANQPFWVIKLVDLCLAVCYLLIIYEYRKYLKAAQAQEAARRRLEQPPPYIDCLITGPYPVGRVADSTKNEKDEKVLDDLVKIDIESITITPHYPIDAASRS